MSLAIDSASLVMPIGDPRDGFFYPSLTLMMDFYNLSSDHRHLGSVEKNKPPPPKPSSPINFCTLAFFHLKYDILYAGSYTGVRKNDLEHMENI